MHKDQHIKIVAWLYIACGALFLLSAVFAMLGTFMGGVFSGDLAAVLVTPLVGIIVLLVMAIYALPCLAAGKGLLEGKPWARILAMVLAVISFFNFPLGTALCIYTFWVLWGKEADPWFEGSYPRYHEEHQFR